MDKLINLSYLDFKYFETEWFGGRNFKIDLSKLTKLTHFEAEGYYSLDGLVIPPEGKSFFLDKKEDETVIHLRDTERLSVSVDTNKNQYILHRQSTI